MDTYPPRQALPEGYAVKDATQTVSFQWNTSESG
jgi:hypothetical protein